MARETLRAVYEDRILPSSQKAEAASVLASHPTECDIATCFLAHDEEALVRHLASIKATRELLERAGSSPSCAFTRQAITATLQHYPKRQEMTGVLWERIPRAWVECYLLQDLDTAAVLLECANLGMVVTDAMCVQLRLRSGRYSG